MKHLQRICLSCRFYRPEDATVGVCRVEKNKFPEYPRMQHSDCCGAWQTCGQQYYIRAGWLKNRQTAEAGGEAAGT